MKKLFVILGIAVILLASGVYASGTLNSDVETFVKEVAKNKGVSEVDIEEVKQVDFESLPEEIKIDNLDDTNLAMYEIKQKGQEKPVYVITVSDVQFKKTIKEFVNKMLLNFGYSGEFESSLFLETATGVQGSDEKGYLMMREGSITGISTNLEVLEVIESGTIEVIIYKNSEEVGFRNTIVVEDIGIKKDYDVVSLDTITFEAGDLISVYLEINGEFLISDVINILEINTLE